MYNIPMMVEMGKFLDSVRWLTRNFFRVILLNQVTSTYFGSYDMTEDAAAGIEAKLLAIAMKIRPKRKHEEL